jgi:anti-sigma-K factor RskA
MSEHDPMADSVAAYVMGALGPEEEDEVRRHLRGCRSCAALERRLRETMGILPFALEERAAPPELRDRILSRLAVEQGSAKRRSRLRLRRPGLVIPLAAAVLLLAAWSGFLTVRVQQLEQTQTRTYPIQPTGLGAVGGANGEVVVMPGQEAALIDLRGLPSPPAGHVYELWVGTSPSDVRAAGVFVPDAAGSQLLLVSRNLSSAHLVAVTIEPGPDGSAHPTEPPRLVAHLA